MYEWLSVWNNLIEGLPADILNADADRSFPSCAAALFGAPDFKRN